MKMHQECFDKNETIAARIRIVEKLKGFIEILDERITRLKEKGKYVADEGHEIIEGKIEKLKELRKELVEKSAWALEASDEKWEEIKDTIHNDFECLKDEAEVTYESITSQIKHMKKRIKWIWGTDQGKDEIYTTEVI